MFCGSSFSEVLTMKFYGIFVLFVVIFCSQNISGQENIFTPWGAWSTCSVSCGGGIRWRERECFDWNSLDCSDDGLWQTSDCNTRPCRSEPVHGQWSKWGRWRRCSVTCGGGVQSRRRACNNPPPSHGGRRCRGSNSQRRRCSTKSCRCTVGQIVFDRCGQRCVCSSRGTVTQCTRIRREFTSMSAADRRLYINTIKRASTDRRYKSRYDRLLTLHRDLFFTGIHGVNHFLPWHRWFILQYENLLRQVDCRFTVSYWDWSIVAGRPWGTSPTDLWFSGNSGYGGNGVQPRRCVRDGPFREQIWQLIPSVDGPRCLRRDFGRNPPTAVDVALLLNTNPSSFSDFERLLREQFHDNVHCLIGGTMCRRDSASAPEFFLHHGFIDKIWEDWQKRSNDHRTAFFPTINENMPGTTLRPGVLINNVALPGGVKAVYAPTADKTLRGIEGRLRHFSTVKLQRIPRIKSSPLLNSTIQLFKISDKEVKKLHKLVKELFHQRVKHRFPSSHKPIDVRLGFNHKYANS